MGDTDVYAKRAKNVVDGLARALALSHAGQDDQALILLATLKPDVASLSEAAKGLHEVVKTEEDLAQARLHAVTEAIASTVDAGTPRGPRSRARRRPSPATWPSYSRLKSTWQTTSKK